MGDSDKMKRDPLLEEYARAMLSCVGLQGASIQVRWNPRLRTASGQAIWWGRHKKIDLNPKLTREPAEIQRTLLHELAHIVVALRDPKSRTKEAPRHGKPWRKACADLGIPRETEHHTVKLA